MIFTVSPLELGSEIIYSVSERYGLVHGGCAARCLRGDWPVVQCGAWVESEAGVEMLSSGAEKADHG